MNELKKEIEAREKTLGRPLSAVERLNVARSIPKKDDNAETLRIVFEETKEGRELRKEFDRKLEQAKQSSGVSERHKTSHWFESEKRKLVAAFNAGTIERVLPEV